jgi:two-component sensor histidine kinase
VPGPSSSQSRWTERYPLANLGLLGDLAAALVATLLAALLRWTIDDHLPVGFPFLTFFPAVILIAFTLGTRAGALTAVLCGLVAWHWFIPPVGSFTLTHTSTVALGFYAFITSTEVALVHWMQRANHLLALEREANLHLAETRELLFRELQHRVSNNLQMVAAMLTVQRKQLDDASARAALDEAARRLRVIGKISRQLYDPAGGGQAFGSFLDELARDVIETSTDRKVQHRVVAAGETRVRPEAAIPLALVVAESIANAIEHGFDEDQEDRQLEIRLAECPPERLASPRTLR